MTRDSDRWDDADVAALFAPIDGAPARCPAPELLSAARAGVLPPDLQAHVSDHLAGCAVCRALAEAVEDEEIATLRPEESERIFGPIGRAVVRTPRWRSPAVQRALLAAAVLLIVTAVWRFVQELPVSDPVARAPAPIHAPLLEIGTAPPLLPSDAQGPLAVDRGAVEERVELLRGLVPYREGDYARSATEFAALIARRPRSAAGHFYAGMSALMRGDNSAAIAALDTAYGLTNTESEDAAEMLWYLAVAQYRSGHIDAASTQLQALCIGRSSRAAPACATLRVFEGQRSLRVTVSDVSGTPLSGVLVGEHYDTRSKSAYYTFSFSPFSALTDGDGRLEISGDTVTMSQGLLVRAAKQGYFTASAVVRAGRDMQHHFTLVPVVGIPVNQTIRGTTSLDAWCESTSEPCRRYAVVAPHDGRLDLSVRTSMPRDMDLWVEMPNGDILGPQVNAPLHVEIDAVAGTAYPIRVLSLRGQPRNFELSIRMK